MDSAEMLSGVGRRLAEAREARQWSQEKVAEKLKLSAYQVAAIEAETPERLPAPVFLRGFLRNYAQLLGLDPETVLLPDPEAVAPSSRVTAPSAGVRFSVGSMQRWLLLGPVVIGLFLVLMVSLYLWLSSDNGVEVAEPPVLPPVAKEGGPVAPVTPVTPVTPPVAAAVTPPEAILPEKIAPTPPVAVPQTPPAAPVPAVAPAAAPVKPVPPAAPVAPVAPVAPAASGAGKLQFLAQTDAWIEVRDQAGQRLIAREVKAGEPVEVKGQPPFKLVVGNAAQVSLRYNGHPIDLSPYIGEKVARLNLE